MKRSMPITVSLALLAAALFPVNAELKSSPSNLKFDISFPASASKDGLDGRLLLLIPPTTTRSRDCKSVKI